MSRGNVRPLYMHFIGWLSPHAEAKTPPSITKKTDTPISMRDGCGKPVSCCLYKSKRRTTSGAMAPTIPYENLFQLHFRVTMRYRTKIPMYWRAASGSSAASSGDTTRKPNKMTSSGLTVSPGCGVFTISARCVIVISSFPCTSGGDVGRWAVAIGGLTFTDERFRGKGSLSKAEILLPALPSVKNYYRPVDRSRDSYPSLAGDWTVVLSSCEFPVFEIVRCDE